MISQNTFTFPDINECDRNPCQNGGTCVDKINSYQCECVPGYTGTNCITGIHTNFLCMPIQLCNMLIYILKIIANKLSLQMSYHVLS